MNPRPRKYRTAWERSVCAFTLIEIVVVLFLMALLASLIAVSANGMIRGATLEEVVEQIGSMDQEARRTAKRNGNSIELHIDTETKKLTLRNVDNQIEPPLGLFYLPNTLEIGRAWRLNRGESQSDSVLAIRYEPDGTSTTWGLTLTERNSVETLNTILILGMTGQMTQWEDHEESQNILAEALGRHAD